MIRDQRIRDPLHGLIVFRKSDPTDCIAWALINSREFQRLRRVRQLGFSDMVYPGAAHSRLAHSIGVFHTARKLAGIVAERSGEHDPDRQRVVLLAALLHDIGHGPFSHTFEGAMKKAGKEKDHEDWSSDIICGDSEVRSILDKVDPTLAKAVSDVIRGEEAKDIYATIVSSQFDADRLDYVQRDRLMTGVQFGHVDADWLLDCLEVSTVTIGSDDDRIERAPCLCLNVKGLRVAEEYLEARHRLYVMVYMHKTTRGIEKMLEHLIGMLSAHVTSGSATAARLKSGRLCAFLAEARPSLSSYLSLDDAVVWAELGSLRDADIPGISELAGRILDRKLYKCFDVGDRMGAGADDQVRKRFKLQLRDHTDSRTLPVLSDDASISVYKHYDYEGRSALGKVLVKESPESREPTDIARLSKIVGSLDERERIYRLYVPEHQHLQQLEKIWNEVRT